MFRTPYVPRISKILSIPTLVFSTLITATIPMASCATIEMEAQSQQPNMHVIRFADRPATKTNSQNKMRFIKSFTTTGFVAGTCKLASYSQNTVKFTVGEQIFAKTLDPFKPNNEKEITLISTSNPHNTITVTHSFYSSIHTSKLADALWSYFGHLGFVESSDEHSIYTYIGDILHSTSTNLSAIIAHDSISAAPSTAPNLYGISITYNPETNRVLYTLTDGETPLTQTFDRQREVTAVDNVKRSIDFGNGISIIADVYNENVYLSMERALEYEIFQVLS